MNEPSLILWLILDEQSIKSSHCNCMAGLGEVCSHVGSVLFLLDFYTRNAEKTVTDSKVYWKLPSKTGSKSDDTGVSTLKIDNISFEPAKRTFSNDLSKRAEVVWPGFPARKVHCMEELIECLRELQEIHKKGVTFRVVRPFADEISRMRCRFPLFLDLYDPKIEDDITLESIIEKGKELNFKLTSEQIREIENNEQRSDEWFMYRTGRITSYTAKDVCCVRSYDSNISLIGKMCYPKESQFTSLAVRYGQEHEETAKQVYLQHAMKKHASFRIEDSGL